MPFHYKCRTPWCRAEFESLTATGMCSVCFGTQVVPTLPPGAVDTFPAPGAPLAVAVARHDNLAHGLGYKITDQTDRSLTIKINHGGADTEITIPAGRVMQNPAGELDQWPVLNKNKQPDWAHFGSSKLQAAFKRANDSRPNTVAVPQSAPVYLRLGFQNQNELHSGFGLVHILFSHNRKSFDAVVRDVQTVLTATIEMDTKGGQGRIFANRANERFLLTCESKKGTAIQMVVDERFGTYNFITMFTVSVSDLMSKVANGDLSLLWPHKFSPK
jgi:hypothetical protein